MNQPQYTNNGTRYCDWCGEVGEIRLVVDGNHGCIHCSPYMWSAALNPKYARCNKNIALYKATKRSVLR